MIKNIFKITLVGALGLGMAGCSSLPQEDWNKYEEQEKEYEKDATLIENHQIVQEEGMPTIELSLDEGDTITQRQWECQLNSIRKTPAYLWKNCRYVIIESQKAIVTGSGGTVNDDGSLSENTLGYTSSNDLIVHLAPYFTGNEYYDDNANVLQDDGSTISGKEANKKYDEEMGESGDSTLIHELWHDYDFVNGTTQRQDFISLYNSAPDSLGDGYSSINIEEFFAQCGMSYVLTPEYLKKHNMDVYNFFEALSK